jgi:NADPH:quinone reductase-like Zn-dependent oxidoreductase
VKAVVQRRYGGPERLRLEDVAMPELGPDGILVRTRAASVNPFDYFAASGHPLARAMFGVLRPKQPLMGVDFAGVVEAVGTDVTLTAPGDAIYGARRGTFAEYIGLTDKSAFAPKPERLTFEQAAAVPTAGLTALQGLRAAGLHSGQSIAITGAAGGVGSFAVQIAKALGAEVTGVCRTHNVDLVRSLGADHVVDYTREVFTRLGRRYDVILDNGGGNSFRKLRRALAPDGVVMPNCGNDLSQLIGGYFTRFVLRGPVRHFLTRGTRESLIELNRLVDDHSVTPIVDRTYPLTDAADALRYLMQRHPRGKVVLQNDDGLPGASVPFRRDSLSE